VPLLLANWCHLITNEQEFVKGINAMHRQMEFQVTREFYTFSKTEGAFVQQVSTLLLFRGTRLISVSELSVCLKKVCSIPTNLMI